MRPSFTKNSGKCTWLIWGAEVARSSTAAHIPDWAGKLSPDVKKRGRCKLIRHRQGIQLYILGKGWANNLVDNLSSNLHAGSRTKPRWCYAFHPLAAAAERTVITG